MLPSPTGDGSAFSGDDFRRLQIPLLLGEDAAAVFLNVEAQLPRAGLAVAEHGAEVLIIKPDAVFLRRAGGDVLQKLMVLIGADEQRRRKRVKAALLCLPRRLKQAHLVALDAAVRNVVRHRPHKGPQAVFILHGERQRDGFGVFLQAVAPGTVLGEGVDVRVVPEAGQVDPVRAQRVDRHVRAGRAADVHE